MIYLYFVSFFSCAIPMYRNIQLLGDSQFVRFSVQIWGGRIQHQGRTRRIGLCVSGQTMRDLRRRLDDINYDVEPQVMIMIGTNGFLKVSILTYNIFFIIMLFIILI